MEPLNLSGLTFASKSNFCNDEFVHEHTFVECFFICEGAIIHKINDTQEILSVGDGVIILPNCLHSFERFQPCIHRDNMISMELFEECCLFFNKSIYDQLLTRKYIRFHIDTERIQFFEKSVINYINCSDVFQKIKYEKLLVTLLLSYITLPDFYNSSSTNDFHARCVAIISDIFNKPNAIELAHQQLPFNKSYLSKKFKDVFGVTMTDYINEMRVKYASYLLSVTEYPLSHICELIGLESLPYFNKLFKSYYHTTPAKYRKTVQKEQK